MVERKEGKERERKGWFPRFTNVLCRRSLAADYPLSVDTGQKNGEPRDGGKKKGEPGKRLLKNYFPRRRFLADFLPLSPDIIGWADFHLPPDHVRSHSC